MLFALLFCLTAVVGIFETLKVGLEALGSFGDPLCYSSMTRSDPKFSCVPVPNPSEALENLGMEVYDGIVRERGDFLVVKVQELKKIYHLTKRQRRQQREKDAHKIAVRGISFEARPGEIFGLLGPNGAGKTTTLRCISTLLAPTEGSVQVCGFDTVSQGIEVRKRIAFLTNELKLDGHFTPRYTIRYFGSLYQMLPADIDARAEALFKTFGISEFQDAKIEDLSTGMKQKLSIAVSLIHDPEVVIFDEPTNGLDIITARTVTDYLLELKAAGKTILISTHIMSVAEKLCDRFAVILNGEIVAQGNLTEVLEHAGEGDLEEAFFALYQRQHQRDGSEEVRS